MRLVFEIFGLLSGTSMSLFLVGAAINTWWRRRCAPESGPVRLIKLTDLDEHHPAAENFATDLVSLGFRPVDLYAISNVADTRLHVFFKQADSTFGVIYFHPVGGAWLDLITVYADGSTITYTNSSGPIFQRPPGQHVMHCGGISAEELYERLTLLRPASPLMTARADDFVRLYEGWYERYLQWRNTHPAEVESVPGLLAADALAISPEELSDRVTDALREKLASHSHYAQADWERLRDRLVVVHDRLEPHEMAHLFFAAATDPAPAALVEAADSAAAAGASSRTLFASLNGQLPENRQFRKLGEMQAPIAADIYLVPDEPAFAVLR